MTERNVNIANVIFYLKEQVPVYEVMDKEDSTMRQVE